MNLLGSEIAAPAVHPAAGDAVAASRIDAVGLLTIYLFLVMALPSALVFAPLGAAGGPATLFAVALMICYLVMRLHPGFQLDTGPQPVRVAGVLFLCSILAAYVSGNRQFMPSAELNGADRGIISAVGWLGVLVVAADGIDSADRLKTLLNRIVTGTTTLALIGIFQFFTSLNVTKYVVIPGLVFNQAPSDLITRGGFDRPTATTAQPLEFAALMVMVLPIAIHQARFAPARLRGQRWLKVAVIGLAIPMTVSRTALAGLAITGLVLLPTWPAQHRRRAYAALLAAGAGLLLTAPQLLSTFVNLVAQVTGGSASTDSRTTAISQALPYIAQHPWFGTGFGTFLPQVYFFTDDQYLSSLITTGAVGLFFLGLLFVTGWLVARSLRRRSADAEVRDLAQSLAAAIAVAAACFGTFDALGFAVAAGLTCILIGCAGAAFRLSGVAET
jgi:O-antigen ligase